MSTRVCGVCSKSFESNGVNKYCSKECRKVKYPAPSQDPDLQRQKTKEYRQRHPEYAAKLCEKLNKDRKENYNKYRSIEFSREMKKYGTTIEWYRNKLIEQFGVCALCFHLNHTGRGLNRLTVDHDHACCDLHTKSCGKCLRGLLCERCNLRLSYLEQTLRDSQVIPSPSTWTERALVYLKHYDDLKLKEFAEQLYGYHYPIHLGPEIRITNITVPY